MLVLTACSKKVELLQNDVTTKKVQPSETVVASSVESLGSPFKSSNVLVNINPANPNFTPLVTFHPNTNSGNELIMIDNGETNNATPLQAFRFVSVNLDNGSYKFISITNPSDNSIVTNSVGRVVRYVFGKDLNLYIVTEGSYGGGGHIIQYNPNTQKAIDLGKPFLLGGKYLDIYSINVGSDGMLYGGSFGGSGEVITFRYNYKTFTVDAKPLDNTSRYVSYISGDANYTYAACGENNWYLYAIPKNGGSVKTLLSSEGASYRIEMVTYTDAPYAALQSMHYKLSNGTAIALGTNNTPKTAQILYTPYPLNKINQLQIQWNNSSNQLSYVLNGVAKSITVNEILSNIYATGAAAFVNNTLFTCSNNLSSIGKLNIDGSWNILGSMGCNVKSIAASNRNTVLFGAYPKGNLFEYQPQAAWNLNTDAVANGILIPNTSNPALLSRQQNADAAGVYGPMYINSNMQTKNNIIVTGGDNDRITASSGRALSVGTYNNGVVKNFAPQEFANYLFAGMCLSSDSNKVYVAGNASNGSNSTVFEYNPSTNSITKRISLPFADLGNIALYNKDTVAGYYNDAVFLFSISTGKVIWQNVLGSGQRIFALTVTPDKKISIIHMYLQAIHFKVINYTYANGNAVATTLGEITDSYGDENTKPGWLTCGSVTATGYSIYVSGLKELFRINVSKAN
ncbi:MAG: hypothetical protein C0459_03210 [Chitinophaga sp.]|nr:hypothetical protein [Chitinophaga sp.]